MDIHILRDGKQTGPFSEETVQVLLKQGSIQINDLAWQPGMPEWLPLHSVLYPAAQPSQGSAQTRTTHPLPVVPATNPESQSPPAESSFISEESSLSDGSAPATPRQKAFLTYIGTPFKADLTKERAALLVNDAMENPKNAGRLKRWDEERLRLYADLFAEEIKAKRENRAEHLLDVCETEGADFFDGVTKAHTQVLVGYLDVRFPNWDQDEHSSKYDYFFPAIAEKFPQLLTKAAKGRFKYPQGPRVSPELVRRPVVRARTGGSFFGAVFRGFIFGGMVLGLVIAAVKYGRGELKLPFESPSGTAGIAGVSTPSDNTKRATPSIVPIANEGSPVATGVPPPSVVASPSTPAPRTAPVTPPGTVSVPPTAMAGNPPIASSPNLPGAPAPADATSGTPIPSTALPPTVSLFDTAPPPATAPAAATPPPAPAAAPAAQIIMGRINKPTLVSLKFGTSTLRTGTPVQVMSVDGASVKIKFGPDVVSVPLGSVDLPESASPPLVPSPTSPLAE